MTTAPVVTITDEIVAELERLAESATGGDWEYRLGLIRTQHDSDGYIPVAVAYNAPKNWRHQRDLNMEFIAAANPGVIRALLAERASLLAENDKLREMTAQKVIDSTMLREFVANQGGISIGLEGGACALLAQAFGKQLYESGATNYIEATFESPDYPDAGQMTVTLKREAGKTPHQLRLDAERDRDKWKALAESKAAQ